MVWTMFGTCSGKCFSEEYFKVVRPLFAKVPVSEQPARKDTNRKRTRKGMRSIQQKESDIFKHK